MNKIAALLITSTAISAATLGYADQYDQSSDQNEPFFWTDIDDKPAPEQKVGSAGAPAAPTAVKDPRTTPPKNPVMEVYPEKDAPKHRVPEAGTARFDDGDCTTGIEAPHSTDFARHNGAMGMPRDHAVDPEMRRRGEMVGDDGVLEAIQDDPCAVIYRRGGPTAESLNEYTHPDDIRRVNTLEDRRIPVHEVGRYSPEGSSLWHRDPNNPFIDASRKWRVERGVMLSQMLTAWGEEAGFNVVWRSAHDYVIQTDVVINGTFPEAAGQVLESFSNANPPIAGDFYISNRVLVVDSGSEFDGR